MSHPDPAYRYEQAFLANLCRDYIEAHEKEEQFVIQLTTGMLIGQCAVIYNLSPPAGLMHPSLLFEGWQEALGWEGADA